MRILIEPREAVSPDTGPGGLPGRGDVLMGPWRTSGNLTAWGQEGYPRREGSRGKEEPGTGL